MLTFPISLFVALVLGFLFLRMVFEDRRLSPLAALVGLCAFQSLIITLAQHYGLASARAVQPITATLIPPVAWLAFVLSAVRGWRRQDLWHLAGPVAAVTARLTVPWALDLLIPALFLLYGGRILLRCLGGPDALPLLRLETGQVPTRVWIAIAMTLGISALSDGLVFLTLMSGALWLQPILISVFSALNLLVIGALSLTHSLKGEAVDHESATEAAAAQVGPADHEAMAALEALMADAQPYLDPDLTLAKLARKTGISAKTLSGSINRMTGGSVSRYINDARIKAAQAALIEGERVTTAMLSSGFNTKSNFNREFLRVTGTSPTQWLKAQPSGG